MSYRERGEPLRRETVTYVTGIDIGAPRFELGTPCTPCKCATRLRHAPTRLFLLGRTRAPAGDLPRAQLMIRRFSQPAAVSAAAPSSALRAQPAPASQSAGSASRRCALLRR